MPSTYALARKSARGRDTPLAPNTATVTGMSGYTQGVRSTSTP